MGLKGNKLWGAELNENVRELCPIVGFGISEAGP
jgi:hypothetical protein